MTYHSILYNCKICSRPGVAKAALDCPQSQIDIFARGLCCNPCHDAREQRMKAEDRIFKACHFLIVASQFKPEQQTKIRSNCRRALDEAVPNFCRAVCLGYRIEPVMDANLVNDFYGKPDKAGAMMAFYKNGISEIASQVLA